jgi:hypothetical protein
VSLFEEYRRRVGPTDLFLIGGGGLEAALQYKFNVEKAKKELKDAEEAWEREKNGVNSKRLERARSNLAIQQTIMRFGLGAATGGLVHAAITRYPRARPNMVGLSNERAALDSYLARNAPPPPAPRPTRPPPPTPPPPPDYFPGEGGPRSYALPLVIGASTGAGLYANDARADDGATRGVSAERGSRRFWDDRLTASENKAVEMARNGYTNREIAEEMETSQNVITVLLSRARGKGVETARLPRKWKRRRT